MALLVSLSPARHAHCTIHRIRKVSFHFQEM
jgi:hypothetical protein